jgi:hypothetical protein
MLVPPEEAAEHPKGCDEDQCWPAEMANGPIARTQKICGPWRFTSWKVKAHPVGCKLSQFLEDPTCVNSTWPAPMPPISQPEKSHRTLASRLRPARSAVLRTPAAGGSGAEKGQSAGLIWSMDKVRKGAPIEQPVHPMLLLLVGIPSLCLCLCGTDLGVVLCSNLMRRGRRRLLRRRFVYSLTSPCLTEKGPPGILGTFVQSELHLLFVQVSNLFYSLIFYSCSNLMRKS